MDVFLNKLCEDFDMVFYVISSKGELVGGSLNLFVCFGMVRMLVKCRWWIIELVEVLVLFEDFSLEKYLVM